MHEYLIESLRKAAKKLDEAGVYWFLASGSCLGYVRDNGIIPHDNDIDIGIYCNNEAAAEQLVALLPVSRRYYWGNKITNIVVDDVDIYLFYPYEDKIVEILHRLYSNALRLMAYEPSIILSGCKRVMFEGVEVNVLVKSEEYCQAMYGPNYRVPDKTWSAWNSPLNIIHEEVVLEKIKMDEGITMAPDTATLYRYALSRIADILYCASHYEHSFGLADGTTGYAIFFAHYWRITGDALYFNYYSLLLDKMLAQLDGRGGIGFSSGLCGIGWGLEYLAKHNFLDIPADDLHDIDQYLESVAADTNISHSDRLSILAYLLQRRGALDNLAQLSLLKKQAELIWAPDQTKPSSLFEISVLLQLFNNPITADLKQWKNHLPENSYTDECQRQMLIQENETNITHLHRLKHKYLLHLHNETLLSAEDINGSLTTFLTTTPIMEYRPFISFCDIHDYTTKGLLGLGFMLMSQLTEDKKAFINLLEI
ncbi:LicD family protein [Chitinophaga flava]|uniref:LicD/FKTN/FKRP nucleotidyltransferase domain-containing protein n=1 Tax=Chitinophaga flava TaxID=2259036 RepID=A0A365XSW7_9BACT|nr:LicD family protein [Chitinophaga flava]RBL89452.1 hypothetical protein DF182_23340 [Chitinophaga flava]